jgi:hypothetical protein
MKRRNFLGLLGVAPFAGPKAVKTMATGAMADAMKGLALGDITNVEGVMGDSPALYPRRTVEWALKRKAKLLAMSALELDDKRRRHLPQYLTPNIACLRSVSMNVKLDMVQKVSWEKTREREFNYLERIILGVEDDDDY